jgi:membrane protein YqaA with SNARE-associated domain
VTSGSELAAQVEDAAVRTRTRLRTAVFVGENVLVLALLAWWLLAGKDSKSNALLVLFLYCFPSEFLVAPVPHEPVLLYFARFVPPLTVALVSVVGTLVVEALNYHAFGLIAGSRPLHRVVRARWLARLVSLFERAPFLALVAFGLAPLPFYPLRFLVAVSRYPLSRYLLAIFLSRTPRFYLLAVFGATFVLPAWVFLLLLALVFAGVALPLIPWSKRRPDAARQAEVTGKR